MRRPVQVKRVLDPIAASSKGTARLEHILYESVSPSAGQRRQGEKAMQTIGAQNRSAAARAKVEPVARALDRLSEDLGKELGPSAVLERNGAIQQTARNAYALHYRLKQSGEAQLALTFMVVGEDADLILMQGHERSGSQDVRADPGQVDQRVYRLDRPEEIKAAVREKITAHLRVRGARH
jgi:hypothetical protein